jgi:tetratricopeptide (TPR) repeat protein
MEQFELASNDFAEALALPVASSHRPALVIKVSRNYANVLCRHHRFNEAFALLNATEIYDLDDTVTYKMRYERAACLLEQRNYSAALELVTQALAVPVLQPDVRVNFQLLAAKCHVYLGRYQEGLEILDSLVASLQSRRFLARALYTRASIHNHLKRFLSAIIDFDRALTLCRKSSPFYYDVLIAREETLMQSISTDRIIVNINAVIDLIPSHQRARYNALVIRSDCRLLTGDLDGGFSDLTASIDWLKAYASYNQRDIAAALLERGNQLNLHRRTGAKSDYDAVIAIASDLDDAEMPLVEALMNRADFAPVKSSAHERDLVRAQSILESMASRNISGSLGRVYHLQSDVAASRRDFKSALKYINLAIQYDTVLQERDGDTDNLVSRYSARFRIYKVLGRIEDVIADCTTVFTLMDGNGSTVIDDRKFATYLVRATAYFDLATAITDKRGNLRRRRLLESALKDINQMQTLKPASLEIENKAKELATRIRASLRSARRP